MVFTIIFCEKIYLVDVDFLEEHNTSCPPLRCLGSDYNTFMTNQIFNVLCSDEIGLDEDINITCGFICLLNVGKLFKSILPHTLKYEFLQSRHI